MSSKSPGWITHPTIAKLRDELELLEKSGVSLNSYLRIDHLVNAPGNYIIKEMDK